MKMQAEELYGFLETKTREYNRPSFIEHDPVSIPHLFSRREDIEIAGFFAAMIAWGQRPVIIRNAQRLMELMAMSPYEFVMDASPRQLKKLDAFVHRTFNGEDARTFVLCLRNMYAVHGGMENVFAEKLPGHKTDVVNGISNMYHAIVHFRNVFFSVKHASRTEKHVSNPAANASAKRINMFLRWMVRRDHAGVDFGLWKRISPAQLCCPLDVHVGNTARALGLLTRKQDDWRSVEELMIRLRAFDVKDPVKYDFALFGLGVFEKFGSGRVDR